MYPIHCILYTVSYVLYPIYCILYTVSMHYDKRLYKQDIAGSIAHTEMLAKQRIITDDEASLILSGGSSISDGISNFNTGAMAAILVVGLYIGLAWIVSNYRERERMLSITQAAIEEKLAERASEEGVPEDEIADSGDDDSLGVSEVEKEGELVEEEEGEVDEFEDRLRRLLDR